jgi:hypothetical protein
MKISLLSPSFRIPRRYLHRVDRVSEPDRGNGPRQWILSRALCHYAVFDLPSGVSGGQRESALKLNVLEWSPFPTTGWLADWRDDRAGVWIWDQDATDDAVRAAGLDPKQISVFPETAVRAVSADGIRLVAALDGCEGQVWRQGRLVSSRWWPSVPDAKDWMHFHRSAAQSTPLAPPTVPVPEVSPFVARPWPRSISFGSALLRGARAGQLAAAAAVVLLLPVAYLLGQLAFLAKAQASIDDTLATARNKAEPIIADRLAAEAARQCIEALMALDPYPSQVQVMAATARLIPPNGTHIVSWSFTSGDLRLILSNQNPLDATYYVRAFEAVPMFERVNAEPQGDGRQLAVSLKVKSAWP